MSFLSSQSKLPTAELNDVKAKLEKEKRAMVSCRSEMAVILAEEKLRRRLVVRRLKKACKRLSKVARRARGVRHEPRLVKEEIVDELQECSGIEGTNTGSSVPSADSGGIVEIKEEGVAQVASFENEENARGGNQAPSAPAVLILR